MTQPIITAIVPVYNASAGLERCIQSIENQTFNDWELLLIDDGSTDASPRICDEYAARNPKIRVIHKENGGVSSARNTGIENAKGGYIAFIDADDFIDTEYFAKMMSGTPADLVVCGFDITGNRPFIPSCQAYNEKITPELAKELVEIPFYLDSPWAKLLKASIIKDNDLRFDRNLKLSEDTLFSYQYLALANTVTIISDALYYYDGSWGGVSKYRLTDQEMKYMGAAILNSIREINAKFGSCIDLKYKCFHLSKLENLFSAHTDIDIYDIYIDSHPKISLEEFLADKSLSPLAVAITLGLRICRNQGHKACLDHFNDVKKFITTPMSHIKFKTKGRWLFYKILDNLGARVVTDLIYIYTKAQYAKNRIRKSAR